MPALPSADIQIGRKNIISLVIKLENSKYKSTKWIIFLKTHRISNFI